MVVGRAGARGPSGTPRSCRASQSCRSTNFAVAEPKPRGFHSANFCAGTYEPFCGAAAEAEANVAESKRSNSNRMLYSMCRRPAGAGVEVWRKAAVRRPRPVFSHPSRAALAATRTLGFAMCPTCDPPKHLNNYTIGLYHRKKAKGGGGRARRDAPVFLRSKADKSAPPAASPILRFKMGS